MISIRTYGYINAKVRTKRPQLLKEAIFKEMCSAKDLRDAVSILSTTRYKYILESRKIIVIEELERFLQKYEQEELRELKKSSVGPARQLLSLIAIRYDAEVLKDILRAWQNHEKNPGWISENIDGFKFPIQKMLSANRLEQFADYFRETPFFQPFLKAAYTSDSKSLYFNLEIAIDQTVYAELWNCTADLNKTDREIVRRLIGIEIDLKNLSWIARVRQYYQHQISKIGDQLLPNGYHLKKAEIKKLIASGSVGDGLKKIFPGMGLILQVETTGIQSLKALEKILFLVLFLEANRAFRQFPLSIGSTIGYYFLVQNEVRNVRIILNSKLYGLMPQQTMALLVY